MERLIKWLTAYQPNKLEQKLGISIALLNETAKLIKDGKWAFHPLRRIRIPKPNKPKETRPPSPVPYLAAPDQVGTGPDSAASTRAEKRPLPHKKHYDKRLFR